MRGRDLLVPVFLAGVCVAAEAGPERPLAVATDERGVTSLRLAGDPYATEFLSRGRVLGDMVVHYRWAEPGARWKQARTDRTEIARPLPREVRRDDAPTRGPLYEATWRVEADGHPALTLTSRFVATPRGVDWIVEVRNESARAIELGDLALLLPMNTRGGETPEAIFEQTVVKHHFIAGHGSFLYWTRPNGAGPFLVMTPHPATRLEFHELTDQVRDVREDFYVYVHSAVKGGLERRGTWRLPHTSRALTPAGTAGASAVYGFALEPAADLQGVRDVLVARGLPDVRVVPGMSIPTDLTARVAIRSGARIRGLDPEHPAATRITRLAPVAPAGPAPPADAPGTVIYEIRFERLGENWVDIADADGRTTRLDFFVTEPIETLVRKRAAFLVSRQQHRRPDRWYDGLFSVWDMRVARLRGPDDTDGYDGWWGYVLASDDPALGKAPFLAAKNTHYPDAGEIAALEYYIERFVWGGLQRTDRETPYPYGVYGVPNWHELRTSPWGFGSGGKGLEHVWRMYDYPHIVMLYFHLYEIARQYPGLTRHLDAAGYLERATQTARAYFTYPYQLRPFYEVYKWGCYNELVILDLIEALDAEGRAADAAWLRTEWEKKVRYFIYDDPYPFRSEYAFDTTAFESTHAIARYAMAHPPTPDDRGWYDVRLEKWWSHAEVPFARVGEFMERQVRANLALRGVIEPAYYYMGSDYRRESSRYTLSYMAQMGGWALLDYALHVAPDPAETLRIGYASFLSSWALVNSGTEASNFGYWFPGRENDGAAGWGFNAEKFGPTWIRKDIGRGAWPYDGEIDLGFGGALRAAATIVTDDPVFGWIALGGTLADDGELLYVVPRDGLRQRLHLVGRAPADRLHVWLEWDGFARDRTVTIARSRSRLAFELENRSGRPHQVRLRIEGLLPGTYTLQVDGVTTASAETGTNGTLRLGWPMSAAHASVVVHRAR